jgi:hypothetical protein
MLPTFLIINKRNNETKKNEMCGTCNLDGEHWKAYKILVDKQLWIGSSILKFYFVYYVHYGEANK